MKNILRVLITLIFFIFPLLWVNSSTKLGCLNEYPCMLWQLFRGLFLWPFEEIWSDTGMQMIMITYALFGIGGFLLYSTLKKEK